MQQKGSTSTIMVGCIAFVAIRNDQDDQLNKIGVVATTVRIDKERKVQEGV